MERSFDRILFTAMGFMFAVLFAALCSVTLEINPFNVKEWIKRADKTAKKADGKDWLKAAGWPNDEQLAQRHQLANEVADMLKSAPKKMPRTSKHAYYGVRVGTSSRPSDSPLRPGDLIVAVDGTMPYCSEHVFRKINPSGPSQVSVMRDGEPLELQILPRHVWNCTLALSGTAEPYMPLAD